MQSLEVFKAVLVGVVQGITEWLPISSTAHMIIVDDFITLKITPEFKKMFLAVVQLGSILAVVTIYFKKLNPFCISKSSTEKKKTLDLWTKIVVASFPAAILGLLVDDFVAKVLSNSFVSAVTLILYGILFILIEKQETNPIIKNFEDLSYRTAFLVGIFQTLALIPGTSRSGATIFGAITLGMSRKISAEFSFFLAIPVILGASFLRIMKFGFNFLISELIILFTGTLVAYLISLVVIKFLVEYVKKRNSFRIFGIYRIMLGTILIIYLFVKH